MAESSAIEGSASLVLGLLIALLSACGDSTQQVGASSSSAASSTTAPAASSITTTSRFSPGTVPSGSTTSLDAGRPCDAPKVDASPTAVVVKVYLGCTKTVGTAVETVQAVNRAIVGSDVPAQTLLEIYKTPTQAETIAGFVAWPAQPAPSVRSARTIGSEIVLDFASDLERTSNITTTNLAAIFFRQIALTAAQFPQIRTVRATIEGDEARLCKLFDRPTSAGCGSIATR